MNSTHLVMNITSSKQELQIENTRIINWQMEFIIQYDQKLH
jgi:hypothetical protein